MSDTATRANSHVWGYLVPGAVAVGVVACMPLLGLAAFLIRPILIVGLVVLVVAALCRCLIGSWIGAWWHNVVASESTYRGVRLAHDVALDRGHCWAWLDREAVVGADDIVPSVLGPVDEVALPRVGRRVERGETLFRLRHGDRSVDLASPVSGTVVARNEALREHPDLINSSPFREGWVVRVLGDRTEEERRRLLLGRRAARWFRNEVDWMMRLLPRGAAQGTPERLDERVDDATWGVLRRAFVSGSHG